MAVTVVEETETYLVCIKPRGMDSQNGILTALAQQGISPLFPVHRLDKETEGLLLLAKSSSAAADFSRQIQQGTMQKEYLALVWGTPEPLTGEWEDLLFRDAAKNKSFVVKRMRGGVRKAKLSYEVIGGGFRKEKPVSLVHIRLFTGRTHQIRVQFSHRQYPLVGDKKYGGGAEERLFLLAYRLTFNTPGGRHTVTAPVPEEWKQYKC